MKQLCLLIFCLTLFSSPEKGLAQETITLTGNPARNIASYQVLKDLDYTIGEVSQKPGGFRSVDREPIRSGNMYWIRLLISNPYPSDAVYMLQLSEPFNYSLYASDSTGIRLLGTTGAGIADGERTAGTMRSTLKKQALTIVYLKVDLRTKQVEISLNLR